MKRLKKILVPTDLSDRSRRALTYGCWLASEESASLVALHVADDLQAWSWYSEDLALSALERQPWPIDRVLSEASLDLTRFIEPHIKALKEPAQATKRVVIGAVAEQIAAVAEEENADLVIMSPQRRRSLRHFLFGGITDKVTRMSPCPVLSLTQPLPTKPWRGQYAPLRLSRPWRPATIRL
jgi:nucleotide-binding universal stress UspA family protein